MPVDCSDVMPPFMTILLLPEMANARLQDVKRWLSTYVI